MSFTEIYPYIPLLAIGVMILIGTIASRFIDIEKDFDSSKYFDMMHERNKAIVEGNVPDWYPFGILL